MGVPQERHITTPIYDTLRDGTEVTLLPFNSFEETPGHLVQAMFRLFNQIVEEGTTYPQEEPVTLEQFKEYYFPHFVGILVKGRITDRFDNNTELLGCFYIKPNYVGRCNHICNGGFLVNYGTRGTGIGSVMGRHYLKWAPMLGFKSSVFNLVFASNVASCKIWENLGFYKIGVIPKAARLKGSDDLVDAIMYGYTFDN